MKRNVSLDEISDGKLYTGNDLVKADCQGCRGCSACCKGMGASVVLDPLDAARLSEGLGETVQELLARGCLELNVVDGIILPNLRMGGEEESCAFLNGEGRCGVHAFRPGICRLFPLGRYYHDRTFSYFLQVHECPHPAGTKVKIRKWIDTPGPGRYENYIADWHYFLEDVQESLGQAGDEKQRMANVYLLKLFYLKPYAGEEAFYEDFYSRLGEARGVLDL